MYIKFNSQATVFKNLNLPIQCDLYPYLIKNEPMFFSADKRFAYEHGGPLTKLFLDNLPKYWDEPEYPLILDSRVHMLKKGWWPSIPGFHHDFVCRNRSDGQPEYRNPKYKSEHIMMIVGDASITEFALGQSEFPEVPLGEICYKVWHPLVVDKIAKGELKSWKCPVNSLVLFDWNTWHQGTESTKDGWRFFIRASRNCKPKFRNEIRNQVQVYLSNPMEGW